jgi:hypothetical protein
MQAIVDVALVSAVALAAIGWGSSTWAVRMGRACALLVAHESAAMTAAASNGLRFIATSVQIMNSAFNAHRENQC